MRAFTAVHTPCYLTAGKVIRAGPLAAICGRKLARAISEVVRVCDKLIGCTDGNVLCLIVGKAVLNVAGRCNAIRTFCRTFSSISRYLAEVVREGYTANSRNIFAFAVCNDSRGYTRAGNITFVEAVFRFAAIC